MAYSPYAPVRRRQPRRWLLTILIGLIIVAIIVAAVRRRSEAREVADYLAVAHDVATVEADTADELETIFATITDIERPEVMRRLGNLQAASQAAAETLAGTAVPAAAGETNGYLVAAVSSWNSALDLVDDAIILVLDEPAEAGGTDRLQESFDYLRIGDLAYERFLESAGNLDDAVPVGDLDVVAFVGGDRAAVFDPPLVTLRLNSVYKLGELHDVAVTALTDPEPLGERNNVPVVPHAEHFIVQAVVANKGNEPEQQVSVNLELIPTGSDERGVTIKQTVAELQPGQARTLVFDTLALQPGGLYELVVTTGVDKDADQGNDEWRMVFYQNENS